jgi:hypothetical protein
LAAHSKLLGTQCRVEHQPTSGPDVGNSSTRVLRGEAAMSAQRDVLGDRHLGHVREMLMHHAETGLDRVGG